MQDQIALIPGDSASEVNQGPSRAVDEADFGSHFSRVPPLFLIFLYLAPRSAAIQRHCSEILLRMGRHCAAVSWKIAERASSDAEFDARESRPSLSLFVIKLTTFQ